MTPGGSSNGHALEPAVLGRAARSKVPRSSHEGWTPHPDRPDPVGVLEAQAESRVQELLPIRYGRMLETPFTFYRGAAAIMAADLADTPVSGIDAQLVGDAHLSNFGAFAAPDRQLVFDVNDFDETYPGPWEWDLKRLVASFAIAGRHRGFSDRERRDATLAATRSYRTAMKGFANMRAIDVWYERLDVADLFARWQAEVSKKRLKAAERAADKAHTKDSLRALSKLTRLVDGEPRFRSDPPLLVPIHELQDAGDDRDLKGEMLKLLRAYRRTLMPHRQRLLDRYRLVDVAHKVVGVGSVGNRAWAALLLGPTGADDPLFLQIKEAGASVLEPYARGQRLRSQGKRVVDGQHLMQAASDVLLGYLKNDDGVDRGTREFYVRQLWDGKALADVELMEASVLRVYAEICGWTLARAHARSSEPAAIAAYAGNSDRLDRALADFAERYADQNELDYAALAAAASDGRITAGPALR